MRYYNIVISNAQSGAIIRPQSLASANLPFTYGSYLNGQTLPGALNVEFDIPVTYADQPMGDAFVRVWGISVAEISQAFDLNNTNIVVSGGFQKGLPLAKPQQSGILVQGYVYQALGNWIGTEMTLDLQIKPGTAPTQSSGNRPPPPLNITLNWPKGTPLSGALQQTLASAFPNATVTMNISPNLVSTDNQWGYFANLDELGTWARQASQAIITDPNYIGVGIWQVGNKITVDDGTVQSPPTMIAFEDMIGQPTWLDSQTLQTKFAMRADLFVGSYIQFPPALSTQSANANSPFTNEKATFQGTFQIKGIRHVGNFRQPDAASWVTVVDAYTTSPVSTAS